MKNLLNYVHNTRLFCRCDPPLPWPPFQIQLMENQANMAGGGRLAFITSKLESIIWWVSLVGVNKLLLYVQIYLLKQLNKQLQMMTTT